jgi:Predicted transcriptional regulator
MVKKTEIAIVGTEFLRDFIDRSMRQLNLGLDYSFFTYETFHDLSDLYKSIPERIGAVITSGYCPARILQLSFPDSPRIIKHFNNDDAGIYKLFLRLMNRNRALDLSRIYADILEAAGLNLHEYLYGEIAARYSEALENYLTDKSLSTLMGMEEYFADRHLALWRDNKVDLSVTRFSSLVLPLQEAGLKVEFVYPGLNHLRLVCLDTIQAVRLSEMRDYQMAAARLTARIPAEPGPAWQNQQEKLRQAIRRFGTVGQFDYMLQAVPHGFELLTNRQTLARITDNFQACRFQDFLKNRLNFDVHIGYGLGDTLYQVRINAVDANREAVRFPFGASCLIDDRDRLIGPLKSETKLVISRKIPQQVKLASKKSGLSCMTVQKVLAAVESNGDCCITARELAYKLSITARSANRFLSSLTEADLARVVEMRRASTMGRPESVYQITIK